MKGFSEVAKTLNGSYGDVYKYRKTFLKESLFVMQEDGCRRIKADEAAAYIRNVENPSLLSLGEVAERCRISYGQCYYNRSAILDYKKGKKYTPECVEVMMAHVKARKKKVRKGRYRTLRLIEPVADFIRANGSKKVNRILLETKVPKIIHDRSDPVGRVSVHLTFSDALIEKTDGQNVCGFVERAIIAHMEKN